VHSLDSLLIKYFKLLFVLLAIANFANNANAQQVIWANKNNIDKRTDFTKVIGQNKFGVYVLKHKNNTFRRYFILEQFDKKMNLLKSKTFKIPGGELEKIVVTEDKVVFFTKVYEKGFFYKLKIQHIDSAFNSSYPEVIANSADFNNEALDFRIEYNQKRDKFMVWYLVDQGEKTLLKYHLCSHYQQISTGETHINYSLNELYVGDALIDDSANLYIMYSRSEKFRSKDAEDFFHYVMGFNIQTKAGFNELINNSETFINTYKLSYNYQNNSVNAIGFHGITDEDDNKGYFSINIDCKSMKIISTLFQDFDRKLVTTVLGIKNEKAGENLNKLKIKKLIPKVDGGVLIIAEKSYITTQSEIFYVNGIPQSSYAKIFNNDEVLIVSIDSAGNTQWSDIILKNQSTVNDGGYYNGIVVMVNEKEINILYNDKLNANADIIQITYKANGEHSKKILLNNEQYYALIIPVEYNQVTSNSIVMPINQNRDFTYIKLIY